MSKISIIEAEELHFKVVLEWVSKYAEDEALQVLHIVILNILEEKGILQKERIDKEEKE